MLVLTRKAGESIVIDENIEVCILEVNEGAIKLGISAPKNIKILRKEIIGEVRNENLESVKNLESIFNKLSK